LAALYGYMSETLLDASIKNDYSKVDEVIVLLNDIKSAWDQISSIDREAAFNQMNSKTAVGG